MKHIFSFFILFSFSLATSAQDIDYTGVWNGKFYNNTSFGIAEDTYRFEVQIAQSGKGLEGVTYSYLNTSFYGKAGHNGYVKADGKKIVVQETRMIELKSMGGGACLMTCTMKYSKVGDDEFLEGSYTAVDAQYGTPCQGGYVKLKKVKKSIFGIEPKVKKKLDEIEKNKTAAKTPAVKPEPKPAPKAPITKPAPKPITVKTTEPKTPTQAPKPATVKSSDPKTPQQTVVKAPKTPVATTPTEPTKKTDVATTPVAAKKVDLPPAPSALVERKNEIVKTITVTQTEGITLEFYDYGEVDGDIVTIYVNNKKVIDKQMLGARPIQVPIEVNEANPEVTVTMYADNLGSVPPNTAFMTVRVDGEKYEATIESSEQKNASVKFVYKKK